MEIIGIKTPLINRGDEISKVLIGALKQQKIKLSDQDILVASSKVLAISENRVVELDSITPSSRAIDLGKKIMRVIQEESVEATQQLAKERRAFPLFPVSIYKNGKAQRKSN